MNVIQMLRDASAFRSAVHTYTVASEHHAQRETESLLEGKDRSADIHHTRDVLVCRALLAELDDPAPVIERLADVEGSPWP